MYYVVPESLNILNTNLDDTNLGYLTDNNLTTQASSNTDIKISLEVTAQNWITLYNLKNITEVNMQLKDKQGNILREYIQYLDDSLAFDIWGYFYNPLEFKSQVNQELLIIADGILDITLKVAEQGYIGGIILGRTIFLGLNEYNASVGLQDFSKIDIVDGNINITEKKLQSIYRVKVYTEPYYVASLKRRFAKLRLQPVLWIGSKTDEAKIVFGYFNSFEPLYNVNGKAVYTLEIQGVA